MPDILTEKNNERRKEMENKIDNKVNEFSLESDHNHTALPINPHALTVLGGYVEGKMQRIKPAKS